jgi:hypothetical protein
MQSVGEPNPLFIASYFEQLGGEWKVYDSRGTPHLLEFNRSPTKPLLTTGWEGLRTYYNWSGIVKLSFFHYGDNKFFMLIND